MPRAVLLRHDLPDGSFHYDWMIEHARTADEHRLLTLRIPAPDGPAAQPGPLDPNARPFPAERLAPHRAVYLEYEGPVSGGRGTVSRLAAGPGEILEDSDTVLLISVAFTGRARVWRCERVSCAEAYTCHCVPHPGPERQLWHPH